MADNLVIVASYYSALEAQMARNLLEAAGIKAVLGGELMADTFSGVCDPVHLQVHRRDARRAVSLLASAGTSVEPEEGWEEQAERGARPCPVCDTLVSSRLAACPFCQAPNQSIQTAPGDLYSKAPKQPAPSPAEGVQVRDQVTGQAPLPPAPEPAPGKSAGCAVLFVVLLLPLALTGAALALPLSEERPCPRSSSPSAPTADRSRPSSPSPGFVPKA
jgi:hypothetical protein